jgi:hypothetical protein
VTVSATTQGGDGVKLQRLKASLPKLKAANKKSADEFMALVRMAIPQDRENTKHSHLVDTLQEADVGEAGVSVSIGDAEHPYPAHLEFGHRSRSGTHVEARPAWFPAKRVVKKRSHDRILRAERAAIKAAAAE